MSSYCYAEFQYIFRFHDMFHHTAASFNSVDFLTEGIHDILTEHFSQDVINI